MRRLCGVDDCTASTKVVGNQRQIVDLDVRTTASFARALNLSSQKTGYSTRTVERCVTVK